MRKYILLVACLAVLLTGCASKSNEILLEDNPTAEVIEENVETAPEEILEDVADPAGKEILDEPELIAVFICGAVERPGVYELPETGRINDAIDAAGGFSEDANRDYVNLAAKLTDGMKLKVPTEEEVAQLMAGAGEGAESGISSFAGDEALAGDSSFAGADASQNGLVNINTASAEQLKTLPGIGDGIAAKIIKYREENGAFKTKEDIMKVSGIKEKLFSRIKDTITV